MINDHEPGSNRGVCLADDPARGASLAVPGLVTVGDPARAIDYAEEEQFHDEWGKAIDPNTVPVIESFEACTAPENRFIMNWLGDVRGLRVLDMGCGAGEAAVYFATRGADVTAVDLSRGMLTVTNQVARRYGVTVTCVQSRGEALDLPSHHFDVVYAANMLHHVDMSRCLAEVCRVLKPDGRFVSWDPLKHNPIINIYRRMAAAVRTEDEAPLSIHDVAAFRERFNSVTSECFWLASLWIFMRFFLIERVHPSKERYWKKIITAAQRLSGTYRRLAWLDRVLLRSCPWLKRMCWNMVVCAEGPRSAPVSKPSEVLQPAIQKHAGTSGVDHLSSGR
ncbi:MAG: class I SAM-dependent methyltransferase [Planctomycetota bacterium]